MATYLNIYHCPCGEKWEDTWSCGCNDKCSECNKEIEPTSSTLIETEKDILELLKHSALYERNGLSDDECEELAEEIEDWLRSKSESAESLFNIDKAEDEQEEVISLKA